MSTPETNYQRPRPSVPEIKRRPSTAKEKAEVRKTLPNLLIPKPWNELPPKQQKLKRKEYSEIRNETQAAPKIPALLPSSITKPELEELRRELYNTHMHIRSYEEDKRRNPTLIFTAEELRLLSKLKDKEATLRGILLASNPTEGYMDWFSEQKKKEGLGEYPPQAHRMYQILRQELPERKRRTRKKF